MRESAMKATLPGKGHERIVGAPVGLTEGGTEVDAQSGLIPGQRGAPTPGVQGEKRTIHDRCVPPCGETMRPKRSQLCSQRYL